MSNMVVNTNVAALDSHRNMKKVGQAQFTAAARLSSGLKINSAADDAAGLAISEKMRSQIRGLDMASKNAQDAISLVQTAEGGMQEIDNMIQRMRELIVYAANDTLDNGSQSDGSVNTTQGDRRKIQDELDQLATEIDSMANRVEFNKKKLINGDFGGGGVKLQVNRNLMSNTTTIDAIKAILDKLFTTALTSTNSTIVGDLYDATDPSKMTSGALYDLYQAISGSTSVSSGAATDIVDAMSALSAGAKKAVADALKPLFSEITITGNDEVDQANLTTVLNKMKAAAAAAVAVYAASTNPSDYTDYKTALSGLISVLDSSAATNGLGYALSKAMTSVNKLIDTDKSVLSLASGKSLYFQIGANKDQGLLGTIGNVDTRALGIGDGKGTNVYGTTTLDDQIEGKTGSEITKILDKYDNALTIVTTERAKLGAYQNRLEFTIKSLDISSENLSAAESRIRDADMGKEMMNLTKANVLQQAATSMLAQNNQNPQMILQLLR